MTSPVPPADDQKSALSEEVRQYVERQPSFAWRRNIMRAAIRTILMRLLLRVTIIGLDNVPATGRTILMMNHISLLDPVLCMGAVTSRYVVAMTKVENMRNPILGPLIRWWGAFSVNRGEIDRKALTNSIELIKSGTLVLVAPEGTRHPEGLTQPKDGLTYIATKADAAVVPVAISGAVDYLGGWMRLRRTRVTISFGRPFKFKTNGADRIPRATMAAMTTEAMYQLASAVTDETRRGIYSDLSKATTEHLDFV